MKTKKSVALQESPPPRFPRATSKAMVAPSQLERPDKPFEDAWGMRLPEVWAWVAEACIDQCGSEGSPRNCGCLMIFAVSVHQRYPVCLEARLKLLREVG